MPLILKEPLNEQEIKRLHEFLSKDHEDVKPMSLTKCHGFLTAILSAPTLILPSKWQPVILGGQPDFGSIEEATSIILSLSRFNNQISESLREGHDEFFPMIFNKGILFSYEQASFEMVGEWCEGYMQGARLDSMWYSDEMAIACLFPFGVFAGTIDIRGEKDPHGNIIEDDTKHKEQYKQALPTCIKEFFTRWQEHRKRAIPDFLVQNNYDLYGSNKNRIVQESPIRNINKQSRNELCECGSGKKYKRCCLEKDSVLH